jgi:transposase-like protein
MITDQDKMRIAQLRLKAGETAEELKERFKLTDEQFSFWKEISASGKVQPGPARQNRWLKK